jgi:hypothetical protein
MSKYRKRRHRASPRRCHLQAHEALNLRGMRMMVRFALSLILALAAGIAGAQGAPTLQQAQPTAEEQAFARLAPDIRQMLGHLTAAQAMQTVRQAEQHLIALGMPYPSPEQFRTVLQALVQPPLSSVGSASAGATSFPPLSPLVAPPPPLPR